MGVKEICWVCYWNSFTEHMENGIYFCLFIFIAISNLMYYNVNLSDEVLFITRIFYETEKQE